MSNWDQGQLSIIRKGESLTCATLVPRQLYALVFYNRSGKDTDTPIAITTTNIEDPTTIYVPGTTGDMGLASVVFVSGDETTTVGAANTSMDDGEIECYIASISMPTNTSGILNKELPADSKWYSFDKFNRFYYVPKSHWHVMHLSSTINQFICFEMRANKATVYILNSKGEPEEYIKLIGSVKPEQVKVLKFSKQDTEWSFQGDGRQYAFFNADSAQNSVGTAKIGLQSLSNAKNALIKGDD